jgi:hypothetical protein
VSDFNAVLLGSALIIRVLEIRGMILLAEQANIADNVLAEGEASPRWCSSSQDYILVRILIPLG